MIIFKATKDTLKDLKVQPDLNEHLDLLMCWHVNIFTLYRKKHYVFMNDLSRLSLTVTGIRTGQSHKLRELVVNCLSDYLVKEDLPAHLIQSYIDECTESIIAKTDSRSVISTSNEIMLIMKSLEIDKEGFDDTDERHKWNNRMIYKPIDYKEPIEVFTHALKHRYTT
ncbi:hypothetical protein H8B09_00825 [Paenibacillus sp. PR3]|uniref:DUF6933 domain-containing protein n=1 Tax=Paenibacillus terricola TaxID=2763503 RepID=A0ABR8MPP2_9BACL|nr:hypothetical protein [Paenibacillus terricola]MBD3917281.1 hypothetical protein [Paenibacillus terricola]